MRHIVYYSSKARTSGNFDDLMKAGRMDIVCHVVVNAFFLSNSLREDVKLHLVFAGPPDPVKHIEIQVRSNDGLPKTGNDVGSLDISKKDVAGLIKRMLYKYKEGKKTEVFSGCWIEKRPLLKVIKDLEEQGLEIYVLDKQGENIRDLKFEKDAVFVLGDHEGLPRAELKRLKQQAKLISLGKRMYFASQSVTILNHELDMRELF
ncbi:MAG: tRNA (pseudouridine(54)-N(1))-methyltransferase TrmY [Candidatus Pacearchaeota archaeon]|nr:tRNA (pseudouridine(54)-N(1))-methyltransferase TrmY [Candidatus Pacearchaeota archaeon]